jgi:saccharopine dehydrogenase-like NADP-dependent oxidoreductase
MRVLILGGYGAVGARVSAELRAQGHNAITAGRDATQADRVVNINDARAYRDAVADVNVVINASGAEDPALAVAATEQHAAFVDITATMDYILALERLDPPAPVLVSVGLAPGLTNLLAGTDGCTEPTSATSTSCPVTCECRCAPTSVSTRVWRPRRSRY